jgi:peroxiredoxin
MAVTSTMTALGAVAPAFSLPDCRGGTVSTEDFSQAPALLVMFMCNHCPYVKHVQKPLAALVKEYQDKGVAVVGISSNDISSHPDDGPEAMAKVAREIGYTFPYLYDESQAVAKAYRAACTPDFFLYDAKRKLAYRGQMDASRPGNNIPVTGADLRRALDAVLAARAVPGEQHASMGCGIKWKPGKEPSYGRVALQR